MRIFIIYISIICINITTAFTQNNITFCGEITDLKGDPLIGATVSVNNSSVKTNKLGAFTFQALSKGTIIIRVTHSGYLTHHDTLILTSNQHINITMSPLKKELTEVIVRENYENTRNRSEVLSLEIIKSEYILENNAGNLIKTLQQLPGVYSMDIGSGFSKPVIRGMGFNRVAVSENGVKQEGQQWGADHGLELDQFNVDKLIVHKGPMSLQYGSDAIGGLIELSPAMIPNKNKVFGEVLTIGKSNNNLLGTSMMIGAKQKRWYAKARISEMHFADYKVPADTFVYLTRPMPIYDRKLKNTAGQERNLAASVAYTEAHFSSLVTASNVQQKVGFFPGSHGVPDINRLTNDGNDRNIEYPYSSVNHFKIINNTVIKRSNWKGSIDLAYQNNEREEWAKFHTHYGNQTVPLNNPDLELAFRLKTYTANLKAEWHKDSLWSYIIGSNSDFQQNGIAGYSFLLPEYNRITTGLYTVESYNFSSNLKITGGLRIDLGRIKIQSFKDPILERYLKDMNAYTPVEIAKFSQRSYGVDKAFYNNTWSIGCVYNPDFMQTYKVNMGRSFRLPSANELGSNGVHHGAFRHEQGDTSLVSEKGYQLDIAYTLHKNNFYLSVNPFANWFSNYIYLNPTGEWSVLPHAGQIYKYTQAKAIVGGGEMTLNYEFHENFTYDCGLEAVYMQNLTDGYPLPFSPPLSILQGLTWHWHSENKLVEEFHLKIEHQYVSPQNRIARNEDVSVGYNLFGLNINNTLNYNNKNIINIAFQIQNIFDTKYFNHLSFYRKLNIPEAGRNIQLILKFPFNQN